MRNNVWPCAALLLATILSSHLATAKSKHSTRPSHANPSTGASETGQPASSAPACQIAGTSVWKNELGSTMTITVNASGSVTGSYQTGAGCGIGQSQVLVGSCNGYGITFSVNFAGCNSTTAWAGTISSSPSIIRTLWYLAMGTPPAWNSIIAGSDCFVPASDYPQGLAQCSLAKPKQVR
jgi:hypothetical protein